MDPAKKGLHRPSGDYVREGRREAWQANTREERDVNRFAPGGGAGMPLNPMNYRPTEQQMAAMGGAVVSSPYRDRRAMVGMLAGMNASYTDQPGPPTQLALNTKQNEMDNFVLAATNELGAMANGRVPSPLDRPPTADVMNPGIFASATREQRTGAPIGLPYPAEENNRQALARFGRSAIPPSPGAYPG